MAGASGPGKKSGLRWADLLGKTGAWVGGSEGESGGSGVGAGGARGESDWADVYGR